MKELDALATALPSTTTRRSSDHRPSYYVAERLYCCHRSRRRDAIDPTSGEELDDVLMFRVADLETKVALLSERTSKLFTTPHFDGYAAVLLTIRDLSGMHRDELFELVADAWLSRAPKRLAAAWLVEHGLTG